MNLQKSLIGIKIAVIASLVLSVGSLAFTNNLYPFMSYKLYTQPLGATGSYTEYRIYSRFSSSDSFQRNPIKETESYDYDSYYYMLNYFTSQCLNANDKDDKRKFFLFAKHVLPGQYEYKIVKETYKMEDLLKENISYDTTTIITF